MHRVVREPSLLQSTFLGKRRLLHLATINTRDVALGGLVVLRDVLMRNHWLVSLNKIKLFVLVDFEVSGKLFLPPVQTAV